MHRIPFQTEGTAARLAWLKARELLALAELLKEQATDISMLAQQATRADDWGLAGTAQNLTHDVRKIVARDYYAQAGNSEVAAEKLVERAIADKIRDL